MAQRKKQFGLEKSPSVSKLQKHAKQIEKECGHDADTVKNKCLLLGEEVGELFKAIRKSEGLRVDKKSKVGGLKEELADVLIHLFGIANRFGIDLEEAYRNKQKANLRRTWVKK
jgi:NTP pyrophosphatase (non-canonical NTP hydrolase)